jgi:hypothetical protein
LRGASNSTRGLHKPMPVQDNACINKDLKPTLRETRQEPELNA